LLEKLRTEITIQSGEGGKELIFETCLGGCARLSAWRKLSIISSVGPEG